MSLTVMLSGTLAKTPEQRTSKKGNEFATTTVRTPTAEGDLFANVTAFSELAPVLARLAKGDPVTIIGTGKVSTYTAKDGEPKAGLSVIASRIIALADNQAPPKERKPKESEQQRRFTEYQQPAGPREFAPAEFDDNLPPF